jgi:hypothetical protein
MEVQKERTEGGSFGGLGMVKGVQNILESLFTLPRV